MVKLVIGLVLLAAGVLVLVRAQGRGFNQSRQAGVLMLLAGLLFGAIGLGLIDLRSLTG
jgi:drug/metabolite transporter (DMT)-like permease